MERNLLEKLPLAQRTVEARLASLRRTYHHLRVVAKPLRRLVTTPEVVPVDAVPLIVHYLDHVGAFLRSLKLFIESHPSAECSEMQGRLKSERQKCRQLVEAFEASRDAVAADLASQCYQEWARLFNSIADCHQLVMDLGRPLYAITNSHNWRTWSVDLGVWDRGINVIVDAVDIEQALELAHDELARARREGHLPDDDSSMVVQIRLLPVGLEDQHELCCRDHGGHGELAYDYMHGVYK